jgi:hypothetical protein
MKMAMMYGVIECEVNAENLSAPCKKTVPVKVTMAKTTAKDRADALLKEFVFSVSGLA